VSEVRARLHAAWLLFAANDGWVADGGVALRQYSYFHVLGSGHHDYYRIWRLVSHVDRWTNYIHPRRLHGHHRHRVAHYGHWDEFYERIRRVSGDGTAGRGEEEAAVEGVFATGREEYAGGKGKVGAAPSPPAKNPDKELLEQLRSTLHQQKLGLEEISAKVEGIAARVLKT